MTTRISLIILPLIFCAISASAEITLVLSNRCEIKDNNTQLVLNDVASIECGSSDCGKITDAIIDQNIYSDGYIDKDEIRGILKDLTDDLFIIYGNAVRIVKNSDTVSAESKIINDSKGIDLLVKKGDAANLTLVRKGISIELYGRAMNDGRLGDIISVELKLMNGSRTRLVKGKVSGRNQVEVDL